MTLRRNMFTAATVAVALLSGAGAAHAGTPDVGYETKVVDGKVVTTLTHGTFVTATDQRTVEIRDEAGTTVLTMPLSFRQDGMEYPLPSRVRDAGRVLELTVVKDPATARPVAATPRKAVPVATAATAPATAAPIASPAEDQKAIDSFRAKLGFATAVGGFIGSLLGGAVGLLGIIGGPTVIASVIAGVAFGGAVGTLIAGGPTLVAAGLDLLSTLTAAPGTTKWNN
ncbi:ammonium transporter [Nocardia huaxiensis]|uniref:Ammonium transporter n=1 Tax=Nocardia huaxiensis TaxID=2755382 RepID=A0A7D7A0E4_9NOCA|nr:ammonium transporter [Nocardia huaxiensis]QLY32909.1 ammonium transporter [Nocardia huaxiensis]